MERNRFDKTSKAASKLPENVIGSEINKKLFIYRKYHLSIFFFFSIQQKVKHCPFVRTKINQINLWNKKGKWQVICHFELKIAV